MVEICQFFLTQGKSVGVLEYKIFRWLVAILHFFSRARTDTDTQMQRGATADYFPPPSLELFPLKSRVVKAESDEKSQGRGGK